MSYELVTEYLDVQRRRAPTYAADEAGEVVDQKGVLGWASTDFANSTGRLFVYLPEIARGLSTLLDTISPAKVTLVDYDGVGIRDRFADCIAVLNDKHDMAPDSELGTAMLLRNPAQLEMPPLPEGLDTARIRRVPDDDEQGVPLELAVAACMKADPSVAKIFNSEQQFAAHLRRPSNGSLIAAINRNGDVVATSGASIVGTDASIYFVNTDPVYRGRGIGTAMTARAVQMAVRAGATTVCLDASKAGRKVYERLGFEPVAYLHNWNRSMK